MFGHWLSVALPDIAHTDLLLVIGANPLASNGSIWTVPDFKDKAKALRDPLSGNAVLGGVAITLRALV